MKYTEFKEKMKVNHGIDIPYIIREQNEYLHDRDYVQYPPIKLIPTFTERVFKDSVDHKMLQKKTRGMCGSMENDPDILAD